MGRADELEAELAVVRLEERLVALKADPNADDGELREAKHALREARYGHRSLREGFPPEAGEGDATVRPAPLKATATTKSPGGSR